MKKYIIAIIIVLISLGMIIGFNNQIDLVNRVMMPFSYHFFLKNLVLLIGGFVLSLIGIPFFLLFLIGELVSCGVVTAYLMLAFAIKGLAFSVVFLVIFKIIYWFLLLLISFYSMKLIKNNYLYLFKRLHEYKNNRQLYFKKMLIISSFILIFSLIITSLGNKILLPMSKFFLGK